MKTAFLIFAIMIPAFAFPQMELQTSNGRTVVLNSNGTWNYKEETRSQVITTGDCSSYTRKRVDKMTGDVTFSAPSDAIVLTSDNKSGISLQWLLINETIVLSIKAVGDGCIDDNSLVNILFTDGTRMAIPHDFSFNCDGKASIFFGGSYGKRRELQQLESKTIATIRVATRNSFIQENILLEDAEILRHGLSCLKNI